jgi:hypothetical protein
VKEEICRVCGKSLDDHALILRSGVAHAGSYDADGRLRDCSEHDCDVHYILGRLATLRTIMRSLRWHAGRMANTGGQEWGPDDISEQADKYERDVNRQLSTIHKYYAWSKKR